MAILISGIPFLAEGHPAHAEQVDYPHVAAFERFYSEQDSVERLAEGGELLLSALNCTACHLPPAEVADQLAPQGAISLREFGDRITNPAALNLIIRNPRFLKRGTTMPSVFAGPDREEEEIEALLHYLLSLRPETPASKAAEASSGDELNGQRLYHEIGCAACHIPDATYRPPDFPEAVPIFMPGLPSSPLDFAPYRNAQWLADYLASPGHYLQHEGMPDMRLTDSEAQDITTYLKAVPEEQNPFTGSPEDPLPPVDLTKAAQGRELFSQRNCSACHEAEQPALAQPATSLFELPNADSGCVAPRAAAGNIPWYYLSELQRSALNAALDQLANPRDWGSTEKLDLALMKADCYACHAWRGRGGPEESREPWFGVVNSFAADRPDYLPPSLDGLRDRRTEEEIRAVLEGTGPIHFPKAGSRMPIMPSNEATRWLSLLQAIPREE